MRYGTILFFSLLLLTGIWAACKRSDDEPIYPPSPISRLYVSFSDEETSDATTTFENIVVFDPADSTGYIPDGLGYVSNPKVGMGITFSPDLGQAYQVSRRDSTIRLFTVSDVGNLSSLRNFKDTINLGSARSIRYNRPSDQLYITNDDPQDPSLNIYYMPNRLAGQQSPKRKLKLENRPWGMAMATDKKVNPYDSLLLLTMQGPTHQIWTFDLKKIATGDSIVANATPQHTLTIQGATDLRGIAYAPNLDLLLVTDIGVGTTTDNNPTDGKVYIIENAKATITAGGTLTPTRIISGATSTLKDPIDVAVADSAGRNQFIYIVDRAQKQLLRFAIDATGDAPPVDTKRLTLTPEFIYLDVR